MAGYSPSRGRALWRPAPELFPTKVDDALVYGCGSVYIPGLLVDQPNSSGYLYWRAPPDSTRVLTTCNSPDPREASCSSAATHTNAYTTAKLPMYSTARIMPGNGASACPFATGQNQISLSSPLLDQFMPRRFNSISLHTYTSAIPCNNQTQQVLQSYCNHAAIMLHIPFTIYRTRHIVEPSRRFCSTLPSGDVAYNPIVASIRRVTVHLQPLYGIQHA
ncbi:hypothetical protein F4861DRAFT_520670 [Xylaria intraflava]|nr:hypothetical protein F4861DRAFT_520670 [Xylaria intraflava]